MSLRDLYYKMEDGYFKFLDTLEKKGINLYKIVDPLEKKGVPTFVLSLIIFIGIIALIFGGVFSGGISVAPNQLTLNFFDESQNPLSNEEISFALGNENYVMQTNDNGSIIIKDLDPSVTYIFTLNDPKYILDIESKIIDLSEKNDYVFNLKEGNNSITKEIIFKTKTNELITDDLYASFTCSDNSDFVTNDLLVTNGEIILENIPSNCGTLIPYINNFEFDNVSDLEADEVTGEIFLSDVDNEVGTLLVSVTDFESGVGLENIAVSVLNTNLQQIDSATTNNNGQFVFENIACGNYLVLLNDNSGIYSPITSEDYDNDVVDVIIVKENTRTSANFNLKKDIVGFINIKVSDFSTNESIEGAEVKLFKNSALVFSDFTNVEGKVSFAIKENVPYKVVVDHVDYIIKNKTLSVVNNSQIFEDIKLQRLDQDTQNGVFVSVIDKDKYPIAYATLKIWNSQTNTIIKTVVCDIRGQAVISNLDTETAYFIEAITGTYTGKTNPFYVREREPLNITIPLEIGEGTYNLHITDSTGQEISTNIRVFDRSTNQEIEYKSTTSDNSGNTLIRIRADKFIYFVIDNYDSKFITKNYNVQANNTLNETITLPKVSNNSNIELIGLFDNQGNSVASVSAGQTIKAKFILNVGSSYSRAQAHIRTGLGFECNNTSNILEQDSIYIKSIEYAGTKVIGSTTFTPCLGEAKDLASITNRDAKWFNVIIDNPIIGSYLIEADLVVNDNAVGNLPLYYRSEFQKGNAVLRYPIDKELGTNISISDKQSLYAYSKEQTIFTGASNFCNSDLCYYFSVLDNTSKITKNIIDKYSAKESTNYDLSFKFSFEKALSNVSLSISSPGSTIRTNNYLITTAGAQNLDGSTFENIDLGNLSVGDHVSGKINLDVIDDSSDLLIINVLSNNEIIFSKNINFEVKPSKILNVELMPSVFVPFIVNDSILAISDDSNNAVDLVKVSVAINNKVITTGQTGKSGLYTFSLPATNLGDVVEIKVNKQGYKSVKITRDITSNLLEVTPEAIDLQIDISKEYNTSQNISLKNNTIIPLTINSVSTNINNNYIKLETITNDILIQPNQNVALELKASVTKDAFDLMTQKVFNGDILINVEDSTLNKNWIIKIPINVRITFGNSVDYIDCLEINPIEQDIRVDAKEEYMYSVNIKNNCTIDNFPVSLGVVYAKLDWENKSPLGDFYISVDDDYQKLVPKDKLVVFNNLVAGEETKLDLKFISYKIKSGVAKPIITLNTTRANNNGVDKIKSKLINNVVVSNYANCINYPKSIIPVRFCALTSNYSSLYQNSFGYNPYAYDATSYPNIYTQQPAGNPLHNSVYFQKPYPNPAFIQTMNYQNYVDPDRTNSSSLSNMYGCPESRVPIKNNCAEDMLVSLDSDYGVTVDEDEISIVKGKTEYFKLQGGSQRGTFSLGVNVKPDNDVVSDFTYIGDLKTQVQVVTNEIPDGCIQVPKTTFDFSKIFDNGPQKLILINSCWDQGWYLENVKLKDIEALNYGNINYFVFSGQSSQMLAPINKQNRKVNGRTLETWTFLIQRNPQIQNIILKIKDSSNPAALITDLRIGDQKLDNVVTLNPTLEITYTSPTMITGNHDTMLYLTDNLAIFGLSANIDNKEILLNPTDNSPKTITNIEDDSIKNKDKLDQTSSVKDNIGNVITNKFTSYNPLQAGNDGNCFDPKAQHMEGNTGKKYYESYGFNRILLDWDPKDLNIDTCDFGNYYCDQTQLYIVANKKLIELDKDNNISLTTSNGKINFARSRVSANQYKVKELRQIKKPVLDLTTNVSDNINGNTINNYLDGITSVLNSIPLELRSFAIVDAIIDKDIYDFTVSSPTGTLHEFNGNVHNYVLDDKWHYQFTSDKYLNFVDTYFSSSTNEYNDINVCKLIKQIYNSMYMYYGVGLDNAIINLVAYDSLTSTDNQKIASTINDFGNSSNFLDVNVSYSSDTNTIDPGSYLIKIAKVSIRNNSSQILELNFNKKVDLKEFEGKYKNNVLFYKPFDAYYYNYVDGTNKLPFVNTLLDSRQKYRSDHIEILTDYVANDSLFSAILRNKPHKDFLNMQEGYILDINKSGNKYNIRFADIRPIQIWTSGKSFTYDLISGKSSLLNTNNSHKWYVENYSVGEYLKDSKTQLVKTKDDTTQVFRTTYFIKDNKDDQVVFVSPKQNEFNFNINLNNDQIETSGTNTKYYFPKTISFNNISNNTYKDIGSLIKGINNGDICFDVTNKSLKLWTEPYKAGSKLFVAKNNSNN